MGNKQQLASLEEMASTLKITLEPSKYSPPAQILFPNDPKHFNTWTLDNYGPITIPKAGETVIITPNNIALYQRIISVYEKNDLSIKNGRIIINGKQI